MLLMIILRMRGGTYVLVVLGVTLMLPAAAVGKRSSCFTELTIIHLLTHLGPPTWSWRRYVRAWTTLGSWRAKEQNRTEPGLLNAEASITVPTASFDLVSRDTLTLLVIDAAWRDLH